MSNKIRYVFGGSILVGSKVFCNSKREVKSVELSIEKGSEKHSIGVFVKAFSDRKKNEESGLVDSNFPEVDLVFNKPESIDVVVDYLLDLKKFLVEGVPQEIIDKHFKQNKDE